MSRPVRSRLSRCFFHVNILKCREGNAVGCGSSDEENIINKACRWESKKVVDTFRVSHHPKEVREFMYLFLTSWDTFYFRDTNSKTANTKCYEIYDDDKISQCWNIPRHKMTWQQNNHVNIVLQRFWWVLIIMQNRSMAEPWVTLNRQQNITACILKRLCKYRIFINS